MLYSCFTDAFLMLYSPGGFVRVEPGDYISCSYQDKRVPAVAVGSEMVEAVIAAADAAIYATPQVLRPARRYP